MAIAAKKICTYPGCGRKTDGGRCELHNKREKDTRPSSSVRGYDRQWRKLRNKFIKQNPLCAHCLPKVVPAQHVDHIVPFSGKSDPLRLDWKNLQSLCQACHTRKTKAEQCEAAT